MKIIKGGSVVSGDGVCQLDVGLDHGLIAALAPNIVPAPNDELIDAAGCLIFPGFIDAHTHFDLNTGACITADDFASGTRAALAGGTTTIIDFATQDKGMSLAEALAIWHSKAEGRSSCHYGFHMAITDWQEATRAELPRMVEAGVSSFKLYMAYDALRVDDGALLSVVREMKRVNGLVGVHCENGTLVNKMVKDQLDAGNTGPSAHPRSRPQEVEAEAVSRLLYISRLADWPVCVVHLSTQLGLMEIEAARTAGQTVVVETCPQYLTLTDEVYELPGFEGAKFVCSPPIRKDHDRVALRDALLDGRIDTVATDHCSFHYEGQKTLGVGDFSKIPNGLPGVEHRPELIYTEFVHSGLMGSEGMCRLLSETPAKRYGMYPRKGAVAVGSDGDLVIWNPAARRTISAKTQNQNVDYTPFEGYQSRGCARMVLLAGEICAEHGRVTKQNQGRYVHRGAPQF